MKFRAIKAFRYESSTYGRHADVRLSAAAAKDLISRGLIEEVAPDGTDVAQAKAASAANRRRVKDE